MAEEPAAKSKKETAKPKNEGKAEEPQEKSKKGTQIVGAIASTMGGFTLGTIIGWSSPAQDILIKGGVKETEFTHISSIMCIGAATAQLYLFLTFDRVGRKWTIITVAIPIIIVWLLMSFINHFVVFLVGRFVLGFCGGAFCVAAPTYIGEYSEKGIRGTLGVMFQLLLVIGIMFSFCMGLFSNRLILCIPMIVPPIICILMMVFLPESPVLLKIKKKDEAARKALHFYRGKNFDVTQDEKDIEDYIKSGEGTFKENFKKRAVKNGFLILLVLHIVQQLSGINAVMFYAGSIFKSGNFFGLSSDICTCILGVVQVVSCAVAAALVEKLGRRMLWLISLGVMAVTLIVSGCYFILKVYNESLSKKMEFILVLCICLYIIGFCFGTGPLPWSMMGEMLSAGAKAASGPIITAVNWILAYLVTVSYPYLDKLVGAGPVFIGYGVICILGFIFVLFLLVETKGKTLDEIQIALGEKPPKPGAAK